MIPVRRTIELCEGVKADLLFTPRLAVYEKRCGITMETSVDPGVLEVMERYADIMYFAALNAWELDGHGTMEDFPHTRGDFHALMQSDPKGFAETVKFAVTAITGKTAGELSTEEEKRRQTAGKSPEDVKKKKRPGWLSRITGRSRRSS